MRRAFQSLVMAVAVTLAGCSLDLTNPNNPTLDGALKNPKDATSRMIVGVMATYRDQRAVQLRAFGSFGRETYYMFITDGRFITGPYRDWRLNNSFEAGTQWGVRYGNYRNAYQAMQIVNSTTALADSEKAAALGVLKTFIALDLLHVIEARGAIGAVVDMTADVNAVLPIVSEDSTYKWISAELDSANASLAVAESVFYFPMHSGFSAFGVRADNRPGFRQFNRALKARVEAKRGSLGCGAPCYSTALTVLGGTWVADLTPANRDNGVYVIYSASSGDILNGASFSADPNFYVHPGIDSISGVARDDRYRRKVALSGSACGTAYTSPQTEVGVSATHRACTYPTNVTPIPIIRNEELVLLRAEAEWFTGNTGAATTDLAAVRANSGSSNGDTSVVRFPTPAADSQFVLELLLQRTLSLFQEGHRWVDYRRFGRLADLNNIAQDVTAGFTVATYSVMPSQECDSRARAGNPGGIPRSCPGGVP
ncbi:MAG TPA: RagB/SusD family nutrient uptake outer membrane protein [Gemmatimonadales bacterium]|nr:RagB/SusD family nutrient uptake outer membrane protein [Gemmatimonadales bacterium]